MAAVGARRSSLLHMLNDRIFNVYPEQRIIR